MCLFRAGLGRLAALAVLPLLSAWGCQFVPSSQMAAVQSQNRILSEQGRAQLAEIENLKTHSRRLEDKLIQAEEQLAELDQRWNRDRRRLAHYEQERDLLQDEITGLARSAVRLPGALSNQLAALSQRYSSLHFDPETGVSKLDTDVLFNSGEAELRDDAVQMLREFASVLQSPQARDLRIMVVGHTDSLKIARKDLRQRYPNNWHLSTARAVAVADFLRQAGVPEERMGVAGFGGHQPIASNADVIDRRNNRRVEIFVVAPETPVVGWTETITSVY